MQLKTVSSFGLACLLVLGVVGVASAQEEYTTHGVAIRVDEPAANSWAAVGDTIRIRILVFDGRLNTGFELSVRDSTLGDGADAGDDGAIHFTLNVPTHIIVGDEDLTGDGQARNIPGISGVPGATVVKGLNAGVDTFRISLPIVDGQIETANNHAVKVVVDPAGTDTYNGPVNNLMTDRKITPSPSGFGATLVGLGVKFGIDNKRPIAGTDDAAVIRSIVLDVEELSVDTVDGQSPRLIEAVRMKVGDEVNLTLNLTPANIGDAVQIQVGLVELSPDSAFSTAPILFTLSGGKLYNPNAKVRDVIEEGDFADLQKVRFEAYLADFAGNLSTPAIDVLAGGQISGDGFASGGYTITIDGTSPAVTWNYPHPDSVNETRITAAVLQDIEDREERESYTFEPGNEPPDVHPLSISFSEEVDSILVVHGDSSHGVRQIDVNDDGDFDDLGDFDPNGDDSTAVLDLSEGFAYTAAGGTVGDLTVTVWDFHGNKTEVVNEGIWHDGVKPSITNLFPTGSGLQDADGDDIASTAPKNADNDDEPTINLMTKNPAFQIDEELDSLAIRYTETGGSKAIRQGYGPGNTRLETTGSLVTWPVDDTTFVERQRYDLEILAIDLAGNASVAKGGTLTFAKGFGNPDADMFKIVAAPEETQVAGVDVTLTMSVLDTALTRIEEVDVRAVTYHTPSAVAVIVSGDQAGALEGVSFSGTGVSPAPVFALPAPLAAAGMVAKAAILDGDGWHAGQRIVKVKSSKPLTGATVMAAEGALDPATAMWVVRISGQAAKTLTVEVAEFAEFSVTAREGQISGGNVAGAFTVNVLPTDQFGNASTKIENTVGLETDDLYESIAVTFASSNAAVIPPPGQQLVPAGGKDFGAVARDISGSATITVRTVTPAGGEEYITGTGDDAVTAALTGSVTVTIVSDDGEGPDPGAPAAPANIVVEDHPNDEGRIVVITFPNSAQHDAVSHYQIFREIDSTTGLDDEGNVVELEEPVKAWVPWTSVSFAADAGDEMGNAEGDVQKLMVPALDNLPTNWGVTAVSGAGSSDQTTATAKRVFTKESIRQTLLLLGMAPEAELLTDEELSNRFNAPEDYVKSIIGDQKGVIFAPVNPDLSALIGSAAVPANIRTAGHISAGSFLSSARTVTEEPVAAVDNIAPAAVTDASGEGAGGVVLRWTASADDRIVGSIPYRINPNGNGSKYNIPILGVNGYKVLRGADADGLEEVADLDPGSTQFTDDNLPDGVSSLVYRIDAFDDNNTAMSDLITVENISVRKPFEDANGDPVYLIVLPSQGGDLEVDFEDFIAFAAAFNSQKGDANYNPQADVDNSGTVDFSDFITLAASFGRTAVVPAGSKLAFSPQRPGVNADTEMTLDLAGEKVLVGEEISVTVSLANAKELNGFGLELTYDADKFEFVSAVPAAADLLKSQGDETPLFKNWPEEGRVSVVNAIIDAGSVSGEGALVTFTFKVLREFEDNARFEIAQGVVFDADQLQNPVVSLGALDVQSTPTEFALHQNFPNPFNPQTNIPYDLAESGDVVLRIYNLLGQEVRTLVRERQQAGRYTIQWSGMDDRGVSVSSGIYFYQVSVAGKFQDAKRLMLLK